MQEFVAGFLINMETILDEEVRRCMLIHLQQLMLDAAEYGWQGPRCFHMILLLEMERDRATWLDVLEPRIQEFRRQYSQRTTTQAGTTKTRRNSGKGVVLPCFPYQKGSCKHQADHVTATGVKVCHCCAFCHKKSGKVLQHPELECGQKKLDDGGATAAQTAAQPPKN